MDADPSRFRRLRSPSALLGVRPCVTAKTACFEALVLEPHFAQPCGRFLLLTWGRFWRQPGSESFMALASRATKETTCVEKSIAGSGVRAEPLEAAAQSVATGVSTVLLWLANFLTVF